MITINGREVIHIHSIQKFHDYSTSPSRIKAVYIEGMYKDGEVFYFKSDQDNATLIIDGKKADNEYDDNTLHTGEYESDMR